MGNHPQNKTASTPAAGARLLRHCAQRPVGRSGRQIGFDQTVAAHLVLRRKPVGQIPDREHFHPGPFAPDALKGPAQIKSLEF